MIKILNFLSIFLFGDQILSQSSKIIENAHCEEIIGPDGKIYSTFGEGPCPYGSKKTYGQKIYCPPGNVHRSYECASRRLDQINNTFDGLREGVVAIGQLEIKFQENIMKGWQNIMKWLLKILINL